MLVVSSDTLHINDIHKYNLKVMNFNKINFSIASTCTSLGNSKENDVTIIFLLHCLRIYIHREVEFVLDLTVVCVNTMYKEISPIYTLGNCQTFQ